MLVARIMTKTQLTQHVGALRLSADHLSKVSTIAKEMQLAAQAGSREDILLGKFICQAMSQEIAIRNLADAVSEWGKSL